MNKKGTELAYYLTLFKIKGHTTWHGDLKAHKNGFEQSLTKQHPTIIEKKTFRIDRLTGEVVAVALDTLGKDKLSQKE